MVLYSHVWDLILKLLLLVALLALLVGVFHLDQRLGVLPMIVILVVLFLVIYRQLISTLSAWLYARLSLGTSLSLAQAAQLARLVQLDTAMKWIPLKDVKKLPPQQRQEAVMAAVARITPQRKAMLI
jgi:hypothetical membrane protein